MYRAARQLSRMCRAARQLSRMPPAAGERFTTKMVQA
jgi:hypothetical protein